MKKFIEELYFSNLDTQNRNTLHNSTYQREIKILFENEDQLMNQLSDEKKTLFVDYVNARNNIEQLTNSDSFITGFRYGARFAFDTFLSSDAPFEDFE